jgi:Mn2+/Fe2+ NRAMP family transporter
MGSDDRSGIWHALGPGMLFAAAAVGVSHLVQSTRAGAEYGLALVGIVIIANLIKYPAFRFGPLYSVATGKSLLDGYRRQGRWALVLYALLTLATMFAVLAAIAVVTAGLAMATLGIKLSPVLGAAALILVGATLLAVGRYHWLDRVTKVLVGVLTVSTLLATALALPRVNFGGAWILRPEDLDKKTIFFLAALIGWMPSAIDVSIWQSLWTLARAADSGHKPTPKESSTDFHVGYVGTAVLALCFLTMGAGVIHGRGATIAATAGAFAAQVISLYTQTLGAWSRPLIGTAAFAVMFSTLLTVVDGFPRALAVLTARFRGEESGATFELDQPAQRRTYWVALTFLSAGAIALIAFFMTSMRMLVDVATTASFLTAPMLSVLNHRAVLGSEIPEELRPKGWLYWGSLFGIAFQAVFALFYLVFRYGG